MLIKKQTIEGILGTIIFHLIVAIIFMLIKLSAVNKIDEEGFIIIFDEQEMEELIELQQKQEERFHYGDDNLRRNIAVNKNQQENELSDEENFKRILESMQDFNKNAEDMLENDENFDLNDELQDKLKDRSMIDSSLLLAEEKRIKEEATYFYKGPTNIYYSFENGSRQHIYLHIPVYKCEGNGKVTLKFDINRDGKVISSAYDRAETSTFDECLLKAAKESLAKTLFNKDSKAAQNQSGTITYLFVAQ